MPDYSNTDQLIARDKELLWHPYTSMTQPIPAYPVESASGVRLKLTDGRELIDGMSSWWTAIHGYNHPVLNEAIKDQLDDMAHVMFGGITHRPAVELASRLVEITPDGLSKVFLCDSGSVSVEVAMKMAYQYFQSLEMPEKQKLLTIKKGYHGDTFGAMSVCDPESGMHHLYTDILPQHIFAEAPASTFFEDIDEEEAKALRTLFKQHHQELAACIVEPVVQGAGGMRMYSPDYLELMRELCDEFNVLLICDEIATGFGRTGKLFACEHAEISPDIMCVGKALTGGYMTLAATLCTDKVAATISDGPAGVLMHGPTFMANPLACAAAKASINLLLSSPWEDQIARVEYQMGNELKQLKSKANVADVRILGAIGVVELTHNIDVASVQKHFVERGVWIRPFRNLIYIMPPYAIESDDLTELTDAMKAVVEILAKEDVAFEVAAS